MHGVIAGISRGRGWRSLSDFLSPWRRLGLALLNRIA